ncbi:hypothetical protein SLE2022_336770 [Rubroshorea leprosula]
MCKLNWRLHIEKDKLWSKIFCYKYSIMDPRAPLPTASSPVIKGLQEGRTLFQQGLKWIPRNGNAISFWNDYWCGDRPLSEVLAGPHLPLSNSLSLSHALESSSLHTISYHLPQNIWDQIRAIPLSLENLDTDIFTWAHGQGGNFSSSSAYCSLLELPSKGVNEWNWVWKTNTLPKIQHFLWLLSHKRLKSLNFLQRLGICSSSICPRCQSYDETIDHIFKTCSSSVSLWNDILPGAIVSNDDTPFLQWLRNNSARSDDALTTPVAWGTLFSFIIWGIWIFRNHVLYRHENINTQTFCNSIRFRAIEFWSSHQIPQSLHQRTHGMFAWSKPHFPTIKLNTDGSSIGNPGLSGSGGIFRDSLGNWVLGYARNIGFSSPLAAELWAIRDGLVLAIQRGFHNLIVESDSKVAVLLLTKGCVSTHPHSTLILDCRMLMQKIHQIHLVNIVRERNMCADQLAKMGMSLSSSFCIFEFCPPAVAGLCLADAYGVQYVRPP